MNSHPRRFEEHFVRELGLLVLVLALALVQVTLLPPFFGITPALVAVVVVCRMLVSGLGAGARWAFYGGITLDLCAVAPLGSHALALLLATLVVYTFVRRLPGEHWLLPIVAAFVAALVYEATLALVYEGKRALEQSLFAEPLIWTRYATVVLLPSAIVAMVPALPVYALLRQLERWRREAALEF